MAKTKLIQEACALIANNLGPITASYYEEYYRDKDQGYILKSLEALLSEITGEEQAKKQIKKFNKNYV